MSDAQGSSHSRTLKNGRGLKAWVKRPKRFTWLTKHETRNTKHGSRNTAHETRSTEHGDLCPAGHHLIVELKVDSIVNAASAAVGLADNFGWSVFPVNPSTKAPLIAGWQDYASCSWAGVEELLKSPNSSHWGCDR